MGEWISLPVAEGAMRAYVARPASANGSGILVLQEAFGVNAHIRDLADRFAAAGYRALAPELFHRTAPGFEGDYADFSAAMPHLQAMTPAGMEADLRAGAAWLAGQGAARIVAAGFCLGGRVAVRAAGVIPLAAAASFYGGNWERMGDLLPRAQCPLLLAWGDRDDHIPVDDRARIAARLRAEGKSFVEVTFSGAGHGFLCDARAAYHAPSANMAWPLLLAFLALPA
jgi:carboxymethylenebutenolidase